MRWSLVRHPNRAEAGRASCKSILHPPSGQALEAQRSRTSRFCRTGMKLAHLKSAMTILLSQHRPGRGSNRRRSTVDHFIIIIIALVALDLYLHPQRNPTPTLGRDPRHFQPLQQPLVLQQLSQLSGPNQSHYAVVYLRINKIEFRELRLARGTTLEGDPRCLVRLI